ncbi:5828_t:CDS:2 [Paraglomus brasilianum]|uniref:5828_t:CDS:1 n=1 Tax=Paraglomus brasilianum TaxID=144538 RepID=A0A9N9BHK2_9GLOM|nr:5828_t:CDS:2 [Paraglomus brasilianum]
MRYPENWVNTKPGLDQVVKKLSSLTSLEFKLTDALIGDALILFEHKFRNIGDILINAFTIVTKRDILSICLRELLNPERTFNHYDLFEFVINVIDKPEEKILFQLEEYAIENPMMDVFQDNNGLIPQACTILKYPSIMYEYMLVKFGTKSRVTRYLMKEIITAHIGKAKLIKFYPSLASSVLMDFRWQELDYIFNTYCMAGVPFEPEFLPLVKTCPSDTVIKCLFDGYLSRLFGFKVEFTLSRVDQLPIFNIIPFTHREHNASSEANKEKVEWLNAINCNQYEPITDTFRRHLEKFRSRLRLNLI